MFEYTNSYLKPQDKIGRMPIRKINWIQIDCLRLMDETAANTVKKK
jgi:hypothetical protein